MDFIAGLFCDLFVKFVKLACICPALAQLFVRNLQELNPHLLFDYMIENSVPFLVHLLHT